MIEEVTPDNISFTLPTVFDEELSFLEFCGKIGSKLNECIDGVNDNAADINTLQEKTAENVVKIQKHDTEIAEDKKSISTLNTSVEALRTDKVDKVEGKGLSTNDYTNKDKDILDKLSKKFELVEQFTLTEDVTQIYRNQKPNGEAYNFNDVIMTLNIPIIEEGSTEAYGSTFLYIVNSETDIANHRVVAQGGAFKKGQVSNISVRAKIDGGIVFGSYGASAGNISNKQAAFTSYSNMSMLPAEKITSVLFTFFGQPIFSGTTVKIYAR